MLRNSILSGLARLSGCLLVLAAAVSAPAAHAAWREVSSEHFVIYADDSEARVLRFADKLERYHAAMVLLTGHDAGSPSPSNRVTIFVVGSETRVRKLYGEGSRFIGGFYIPRAGGSIAIVPDVEDTNGDLTFSMVTLLHEYAHHFTLSSSNFPTPRWMSEGAAEFFSAAKFERDGSVWLGRPATHRAGELFFASDVKIDELLDSELYAARKGRSTAYDAYYGRAWLLYHYMTFEAGRRAQLAEYTRLLASGTAPLKAAEQAFGDLKQLDKELDAYLNRKKVLAFRVPPDLLTAGPVAARVLRPGEAEMISVRVRSRRGVDDETAQQVVREARTIASKYPDDPAVAAALAEAEFDAGNSQAAIAAADKAIAADPKQTNAYIQKGYSLLKIATTTDGPERSAAFDRARSPFLALNRLENDHPLPLIYFYQSYVAQGHTPPAIAKQGLERASELAPFDLGLHLQVARMLIVDGEPKRAKAHLKPVAYSPHGGNAASGARTMIAAIDEGRPVDFAFVGMDIDGEDADDE